MEVWKESVLGILVVSIVCSILLQIIPQSGRKEILQIISGVLLTVMILQPLSDIRLDEILDLKQYAPESADTLLASGKAAAESAKRQYITNSCEAYILDKAKALGAEILPVITVDESFLPVFAEIQGSIDPQTQKTLEQILIHDMGITKENQRWTGNPENGD